MRLGWLLLLFPSVAFAIAGCPVGVQLGNVTLATPLPVCLKFETSELGGCQVNCVGVCVDRPLLNQRGPVETTGVACKFTGYGDGSGSGDSDGSGNTPAEGGNSGNGGLPKNWDFFNPVIGDATGTSVSATIAKLNKNLGQHIGAFSENTDKIYQRVNQLTGDSRRIVNASEAAQQSLKEIAEYNRVAAHKSDGFELYLSRMESLLQNISLNTAKSGSSSGSGSGSGSSGSSDSPWNREDINQIHEKISRLNMVADDVSSITSKMNYQSGILNDIRTAVERGGFGGSGGSGGSEGGGSGGGSVGGIDQEQLFYSLGAINDNISRTSGSTANNTSELLQAFYELQRHMVEGGGGSGVDYSKMPGSSSNPLFVGEASYQSQKCLDGAACFFDLPTINKKLEEANSALTNQYRAISEDVKQVFSFNLSGSADPMECLDLFTFQGKEYSVCPPSADYWKTLAALMMFIFYFVALMIVFKR